MTGLQREEQCALLVEDRRMRSTDPVRQWVLHDLSGPRIQLADVGTRVRREPDIAGAILDQAVRTRTRLRHREFLHLSRRGIQPAQPVGELPRPPERTVGGRQRIVRSRAEGWHHPFLERDVRRPRRSPQPREPVSAGKFSCEVGRDGVGLALGRVTIELNSSRHPASVFPQEPAIMFTPWHFEQVSCTSSRPGPSGRPDGLLSAPLCSDRALSLSRHIRRRWLRAT